MSKRYNMREFRKKLRRALKSCGDNCPPRIGHGKRTGWKREHHKRSFLTNEHLRN